MLQQTGHVAMPPRHSCLRSRMCCSHPQQSSAAAARCSSDRGCSAAAASGGAHLANHVVRPVVALQRAAEKGVCAAQPKAAAKQALAAACRVKLAAPKAAAAPDIVC